jgi:uncharacterized DUF497 family protein
VLFAVDRANGQAQNETRRSAALRITGFVWLEQYVEKLERKHDVTPEEVEALFFARPKYRLVETGNIEGENLYSAMGRTEEGRYLVVFFIHKQDGRALIISARSMDQSEKNRYGRK